ncbi:hypothetical protein ACHAXA_008231 [Cyclostephanos tholiformis]|uniref:Uncharacterized protein n=1 Tax=Cyclostephanos tholiformis TaxID=382380 RepID=A0ABD3R2V7_9STRA
MHSSEGLEERDIKRTAAWGKTILPRAREQMSGKGEDASNIKSSRLKKRRLPTEIRNDGTIASCSLQHLHPSYGGRRRIGRHGDDNIDDDCCKENILNGLPSSYHGRGGVSEGGENDVDDEVRLPVVGPPTKNESDGTSSAPSTRGWIGVESPTSTDCVNRSWQGFMDDMDQSALFASSIPSMLGIDFARYENNSTFEQCLKRAFGNDSPYIYDRRKSTVRERIYHPLVGRIDVHSIHDSAIDQDYDDEHYSIAFPRCYENSRHEPNPTQGNSKHGYIDNFNLGSRKTGHGMRLPMSWYRFPQSPQIMRSSSSTGTDSVKMHRIGVRGSSKVVFDDTKKSAEAPTDDDRENSEVGPAKYLPPIDAPPIDRGENGPVAVRDARERSTSLPDKYLGKIRIEPGRQATIREVFDIDKSNVVIGTLREGEERYFIRRRTLPPPPQSDNDDDDDECVAVVRYEIALEPADWSASRGGRHDGFCDDGITVETCDGKPMAGWISDRGRLADDSYLILREI